MASPLICITGATASGKSALSVALAKKLDGEVVCVDAVQVYRFANIGSAKLSMTDRAGIPHHCLDLLDPDQQLDAAKFGALARDAIQDIQSRGKTPIVCIGSSMYFQALLYGLVGTVPKNEWLRAALEKIPSTELHDRLLAVDPAKAAKLHPNDSMRIIRALEVAAVEVEGLSSLQETHGFREPLYVTKTFCLSLAREDLYQRIDTRTRLMIDCGLIAESEAILQRFGEDSQLFRSIGYRQAKDFLEGSIDAEKLYEEIAQATRNYAKRQLTFWKNEPGKRGVITHPEQVTRTQKIADPISLSMTLDTIIEAVSKNAGPEHYFISPITAA